LLTHESYAFIRRMRKPTPLDRAKNAVGGAVGLSKLIGITSQAVSQWKRVPAERVIDVERATGVPREELRPDLYRRSGNGKRRQPARVSA
jgi:DNA-binding transcriptional regulator YdaS (Cro superfamily)